MARNLPFRASLIVLAVSLACAEAGAVGLGEPAVHSYIGSPLRLDIPLRLSHGEQADEHCISLQTSALGNSDSSPVLPMQLKVVTGDHPHLLITSDRVAREPYASFRVRVECGGASLVREFAVLLDPPPQPPQVGRTVVFDADAVELPGSPPRAAVSDGPALDTSSEATEGAKPAAVAGPRRATGTGTGPQRSFHPVQQVSSPHSQLKLEVGGMQARKLAGIGGTGEGSPTLRLDMHMELPPPVTASLVTQRAQLRDLRALMLSGDDTLERLLALQTQVGTLETQLKALQGGGAAPGAPAPAAAGTQAPVANVGSGTTQPGAGLPSPAMVAGTPATPAATVAGAPATGTAGAAADTPAPGTPATDAAAPPASGSQPAADGSAGQPAVPPPQVKVTVRKPPPPPPEEDFDWTLPAAGGGVVLLGAAAVLFLRQRRRRGDTIEELVIRADEEAMEHSASAVPGTTVRTGTAPQKNAGPAAREQASQSAEQAARAAYLAQRFPEIAAGLIDLHDPDSVVNGARLYVESGDHDRAEEVLEAGINDGNGNDVRPWLGLFEVLRLRKDADTLAEVLGRFRLRFASSRYLPEILAVGRTLDPGRTEFQALPGSAPPPEIGPDGTTWLNPELDFVPQALAQDLHDTLMADLSEDEFTLSPVEDRRT